MGKSFSCRNKLVSFQHVVCSLQINLCKHKLKNSRGENPQLNCWKLIQKYWRKKNLLAILREGKGFNLTLRATHFLTMLPALSTRNPQ